MTNTIYRNISRELLQERMETAILNALDNVVNDTFGVSQQGWRDQDLRHIILCANEHSKIIIDRYGDSHE